MYIYIYVYIYIYDPGLRSRSPPQWYGPLLPDQNLSFPWYLQHFGCKTSYYLYYLQELKSIVILPLYYLYYLQDPPTSHIHGVEGGTMTMGGNHDHGGETIYTQLMGEAIYTQLPFTGERGGTMTTYTTYRTTSTGGRGNHDHGGRGSPNLEHIYP